MFLLHQMSNPSASPHNLAGRMHAHGTLKRKPFAKFKIEDKKKRETPGQCCGVAQCSYYCYPGLTFCSEHAAKEYTSAGKTKTEYEHALVAIGAEQAGSPHSIVRALVMDQRVCFCFSCV